MEPLVLLEKLRALISNPPPLSGRGAYGQDQFAWLGKASALVSAWDRGQGITFGVAANSMAGNFNREMNYGAIFTTIHRAISAIEDALPAATGQAFGPGAAYDFFKALRALIASVEVSVFIVDPYMDAETFDGYLNVLPPNRSVRLLLDRYANDVLIAARKFSTQSQQTIASRKSSAIHDRVVFVDGSQCWVLGASIKDAATKKPTYLAPLSSDIAHQKSVIYQGIWDAATPI